MKERWKTLCLVFSADYEGILFADGMLSFAAQEKWKILKILWLINDTVGNRTKSELREIITKGSDAIIMHGRLSQHHAQFFEMIEELNISKQRTMWVITDITSNLITSSQKIPQGLLKVSLKRPKKHHDYIVYDDVLHDAMSIFQLSFEESVTTCYENTDLKKCTKERNRKTVRRTAKRYPPLLSNSSRIKFISS